MLFVLFVCLVVGNQEGRVQYKTRMSKEDFRQRRNDFREHSRPLGNGVMKGFTCYSVFKAFNWASHLKHRILKMIVWYEMIWKEGE